MLHKNPRKLLLKMNHVYPYYKILALLKIIAVLKFQMNSDLKESKLKAMRFKTDYTLHWCIVAKCIKTHI